MGPSQDGSEFLETNEAVDLMDTKSSKFQSKSSKDLEVSEWSIVEDKANIDENPIFENLLKLYQKGQSLPHLSVDVLQQMQVCCEKRILAGQKLNDLLWALQLPSHTPLTSTNLAAHRKQSLKFAKSETIEQWLEEIAQEMPYSASGKLLARSSKANQALNSHDSSSQSSGDSHQLIEEPKGFASLYIVACDMVYNVYLSLIRLLPGVGGILEV